MSALIPLIASIIFKMITQAGAQQLTREQIEADLAKALADSGASVIIAEAQGESWLQRNWRPLVALTSFFSYWFVIVAYPFLYVLGLAPRVSFGEVGLQNLFWLTTICVGGYMTARTVEKFRK